MDKPIEITKTERSCLEYLRQGKSQKETALLLFVSETKVERIFKELRDRFDCENNYQLLAFAYENYLLTIKKEIRHNSKDKAA
jgi:DNA-binding CsgD family transcriptional regulator